MTMTHEMRGWGTSKALGVRRILSGKTEIIKTEPVMVSAINMAQSGGLIVQIRPVDMSVGIVLITLLAVGSPSPIEGSSVPWLLVLDCMKKGESQLCTGKHGCIWFFSELHCRHDCFKFSRPLT